MGELLRKIVADSIVPRRRAGKSPLAMGSMRCRYWSAELTILAPDRPIAEIRRRPPIEQVLRQKGCGSLRTKNYPLPLFQRLGSGP
ncbi:hypothetical protein ATE69_09955 [Sphingopyxis sp. H071]|nr:hypothetical protein ATE61_07535 [Sphingopyxis sp. H057]KTE52971.1 hypothetical protein ATE64_09980 [Sphingopyxis sp. H073]KTE55160.1 hypothetical protein ATE69_09955 [Sphingopyxis sp. H071]KTE59285.1 hypothetical protein ATE66_11370 [Sphingopyxis sp. H107]KTE64085.1 hypothetical protein ATE65_13010 [Sphingopyxis sp. H100]KTE72693.1 hypothetical protein ATE60_08695 [Sphingopyxis sp. H081]KTE80026.1 hypothetical protein ATE63_13120 [Sphingopyxis sp. H067]